MSDDLLQAINRGELTTAQLRELIEAEAAELGLSFDEAIAAAREDTMPHNATGSDLRLLIELLEAVAAAA
jgi:hypothetical protein